MGLHKNLVLTDIHSIVAFVYADASARTGAVGLVAADVRKVAHQTDNNTFWVLLDESPVTWGAIGGGSATDELVKVSADDTTAGFLNGKLVDGLNTTLVEGNGGANEILQIDVPVATDSVSGVMHFEDKAAFDLLRRNWLIRCRAVSTANTTRSGAQTVDGVSCVTDDRVLLRAQTADEENGVYIVAAGAWSRAPELNEDAEFVDGSLVQVGAEGTDFPATLWRLSCPQPFVVGTDVPAFELFGGVAEPANAATFDIAATGDQGTENRWARSSHTHGHGNFHSDPDNHNVATSSSHGFMAAADKEKLDLLPIGEKQIPAVATDDPNNSNWAVNAIAALVADSANSGLVEATFDDTTEEGRGFELQIPLGTVSMRFTFWCRAQSSPPATRTVGPKLYKRLIAAAAGGTAVSTWESVLPADFSFTNANNTFWISFQRTVLLTDYTTDMVAGDLYQFEFTRVNPSAGTELSGDMNLKMIVVEFLP